MQSKSSGQNNCETMKAKPKATPPKTPEQLVNSKLKGTHLAVLAGHVCGSDGSPICSAPEALIEYLAKQRNKFVAINTLNMLVRTHNEALNLGLTRGQELGRDAGRQEVIGIIHNLLGISRIGAALDAVANALAKQNTAGPVATLDPAQR